MRFALPRVAPLRATAHLCMIAGLALSGGCARYSRSPLAGEEFRKILERWSPADGAVVEAIADEAYAPADGLTLAEAELLALHLNPRLRAARQDTRVLAASARYAGLWDDPEVGADALRILKDVEEPWIAGASLSFSIPVSGRLAVAKAQADAEARAGVVEAWAEEQQVLLELREAWARWEGATEALGVSRRLHGDLRRLVELTDRREELGELIVAEAVAFRLEAARLGLEIERLEAEEVEARLGIVELLGLLPEAEVPLVAGGREVPDSAFAPEEVLDRSPQVLLAAARHEAAEERLRLEVRKQYPDITLGPLYGNEEGMNRLGVGFSVPIPVLNANRQGIAEAEAARDAARARWEQAVQEGLASLARGQAALRAARRRVATLEGTVVPLAREQIGHARKLAELGELDTLLVLEALQSEREAALELIAARADVRSAEARLRFVVPEDAPARNAGSEEPTR